MCVIIFSPDRYLDPSLVTMSRREKRKADDSEQSTKAGKKSSSSVLNPFDSILKNSKTDDVSVSTIPSKKLYSPHPPKHSPTPEEIQLRRKIADLEV